MISWIHKRLHLNELPVTRRGCSVADGGVGRCLGFLLLWLFLAVVLSFPLMALSYGLLVRSPDDNLVIGTLAGFVAAAWATKYLMRSLEKRPFADVGLHWNRDGRWNLWLGVAVGSASAVMAVIIPIAMGLGEIRAAAVSKADLRNFLFLVVIFSIQPIGEELVSRGYPFQVLIRRFGFLPAVLGTSVLFTGFHLGNPHASALSTFSTFLVGVVLACAVCRSGGLWLPTGIHTGWNVVLPLLGVNLSGWEFRMTRFELQGCNDKLWCGGAYGVEASLPSMLLYAVMLVGICYLPSTAPRWFEPDRVDSLNCEPQAGGSDSGAAAVAAPEPRLATDPCTIPPPE